MQSSARRKEAAVGTQSIIREMPGSISSALSKAPKLAASSRMHLSRRIWYDNPKIENESIHAVVFDQMSACGVTGVRSPFRHDPKMRGRRATLDVESGAQRAEERQLLLERGDRSN